MTGDPTRDCGDEADEVGAGQKLTVDAGVQDILGRALRAYSDDLVNAPIPDKFLALLAQLESKEREGT